MIHTAYVKTLGCEKNSVDGQVMQGALAAAGFRLVESPALADAIVINTCGFIESAVRESIDCTLRLARHKRKRARAVVVAGCMPERFGENIRESMPEVDAIVGAKNPQDVVGVLSGFFPTLTPINNPQTPRLTGQKLSKLPHVAYVKLAEGCDARCSYCTIPKIRGSYVSRQLDDVLDECRALVAGGACELILVAQNTALYGADFGGKPMLDIAIRKIARESGAAWVRLMYLNPQHITDSIIHAIASEPNVCKYIDVPMQHCNADVLSSMNRTGCAAEYDALVRRLRGEIPHVAIRTSLMVGFPGETRKCFLELSNFVSSVKFERLGVFEFSREAGTAAAQMLCQVKPEARRHRRHVLMTLQQEIHHAHQAVLVGKHIPVMVDRAVGGGKYIARSEYDAPNVDARVFLRSSGSLVPGQVCIAKITRARAYDLVGTAI